MLNLLAIDQILKLLKNGEWHGLKEIAEKIGLQEFKVEVITSFLAEYNFLNFNKKENKIKISPELLFFLKKVEELDPEGVTGQSQFH
jgi:DNA-binding IclR family transcriptional regulator